jgi:hypothetical protein
MASAAWDSMLKTSLLLTGGTRDGFPEWIGTEACRPPWGVATGGRNCNLAAESLATGIPDSGRRVLTEGYRPVAKRDRPAGRQFFRR